MSGQGSGLPLPTPATLASSVSAGARERRRCSGFPTYEATLVRTAPSAVVAYTFDLHDFDRAEDITRTAEWFRESCGIATFFVPSAMFAEARYAEPLRRIQRLGHEVASHTHAHDWREVDALMEGSKDDVAFLAESFDRHGQFFGAAPTSFRSPRWCALGPAAIEELARLGYAADSSATPQRFPLFSSKPLHPGWWSSPRRPHYLAPGLLEIPTSTLLVPAAAPTFLTLRAAGSRALLALLELEARLDVDHPIVLQFHVEDFLLDGRRESAPERLSWAHLLPRARGGFALKHFLRDRDPGRIVRNHLAILERFAGFRCSTITGIARDFVETERSRALSAGAGNMSKTKLQPRIQDAPAGARTRPPRLSGCAAPPSLMKGP